MGGVLQDVLLYHVADEELLAQQLFNDQVIDMMNTDSILITIDEGTVVINDNAEVVAANIIASNGVLHGIDRVLIPPELNVEEFLETCTSGLVSECYGSISTRAAGDQFGACDCGMTKEECDAEPKDGQFPIWAPGGCANICLCTVGFGCYQSGPDPPETQNNCDCSPEACEGGDEACKAKGETFFWTDQCRSCQCPSEEYDPTCKPKKEPEPAPEPTPQPVRPRVSSFCGPANVKPANVRSITSPAASRNNRSRNRFHPRAWGVMCRNPSVMPATSSVPVTVR